MGFYRDLQIQLQILLSAGDAKGAESVARAATQRHSQSVPVWSLCLQTLMQLESGDVGQLFQAAHRQINPKVHWPQGMWFYLFGHLHCSHWQQLFTPQCNTPHTLLCNWVTSLAQLVSILFTEEWKWVRKFLSGELLFSEESKIYQKQH